MWLFGASIKPSCPLSGHPVAVTVNAAGRSESGVQANCSWLSLVEGKKVKWNTPQIRVLTHGSKIHWFQLEHFFRERKNAKFSISVFCILLNTTLNIREILFCVKLLWGLEGTFHSFLLDKASFRGSRVHSWKQIQFCRVSCWVCILFLFLNPQRQELLKLLERSKY